MASPLSDVLSAANAALADFPAPENIDHGTRMQLLATMDKLRAALEPPRLTVLKHCLSYYVITAVRVGQGMGIFDAFANAEGPTKQLTADALHEKTKGERELLVRLMRYLSAQGIFKEVGKETYEASPLALELTSVGGDAVKHFYLNMRTSSFLYEYFEKNGYVTPSEAYDAPFQFAHSTKQHFFEFLDSSPEDQAAFNSVMTMSRTAGGVHWHQFYPVAERLQGISPDRVLLIDIGGGVGHDISTFKAAHPSISGKLIVQDLPQAIAGIKSPLPEGIEAMGYNMFDVQPVTGAKAYYMRTVLHDWPDKQALEALAQIKTAMAEDSLLLINENTLPESNVSPVTGTLDLVMMQTFSSLERTEKQWVALLEKAGFEVLKVWKPDSSHVTDALYEAVPKKSA
ncbi:O-methyltransferase [Aspergillus heteromorphus CBS 117.55]|uniref:O-methyltransferase n=1 Tax=Aspergillus heteromorphus CBS 117.55 TaxID=1448321 RepID=A0A317WPE8_9EURO|nr:O-methyltransferase [Aspergillus heteromorphus CBS 117.55]PWY88384.1 O-methyltransferase [Aspergillus heteromorphus CBS 117.55]